MTKTITKESKKISAGLSARLLLWTIFFIMVAEVFVYVPSVSRYRKTYLEERIVHAYIAVLALADMPQGMVNKKLERQLMIHAGAHGIVLHLPERKVMAMRDEMPPKVDMTFDLRKGNVMMWIMDAFDTLLQNENRVLRVIGSPPKTSDIAVEVVIDETPMRQEMYAFSTRILQLSIVISVATALLVYLTLFWLMVRPMRRITASMIAFRDDPEDETRTIAPSNRHDEIGVAERELNDMQEEVRTAFRQKTRLATLGAAVAKINHDLRNTLATAILASDRLASIDDPEVKRVTPRLYTAIDRAVTLCSDTLNYVADGIPKLDRTRFPLGDLVDEVGALILSPEDEADDSGEAKDFEWRNEVPKDTIVYADRKQLFRVLQNLGHNARQAGAGWFRVYAQRKDDAIEIELADNGPGLPAQAKEHLFQPFAGSVRKGGSGLGLVIARDIMHAHGGDVTLVRSDHNGTLFRLTLPVQKQS